MQHIKKMTTSSSQEPYLEKLRDLTNIPIDILRRDLMRQEIDKKNTPIEKKDNENVLISRENGNIRAVKFVLASLIHDKDYVDKRIDYEKLLPRYKNIIDEANKHTKISCYYDLFDMEENPILKDCILFNFEDYNDTAPKYFAECLWLLADQILKQKQQKLTEEFKNAKTIDDSLEDFYVG